MKKTKKQQKKEAIKELAEHLEKEVNSKLNVVVLPNGAVGYKDFLIKTLKTNNWGIININSKAVIGQFYLKSSALMAAKAYSQVDLDKYQEIKKIDRLYWTNYCDNLVYKRNIKTAKDFERYLVLLNKLEHSEFMTQHYKDEISRMFKWSFV